MPTSVSKLVMFLRMFVFGVWMRAIICTKKVGERDRTMTTWTIYLRNHFKPCVYFDCAEPAGNRMADFILGTEFEPKS